MLPEHHRPDRLEYVIRFFWGTIAGLVFGFCLAMHDESLSTSKVLLELFIPALVLGTFAAWLATPFGGFFCVCFLDCLSLAYLAKVSIHSGF